MKTLLITKENHVTTVTLNRPDVHNAFNEDLMVELKQVFTDLAGDADTKIVVLTANGKSFCAGGDLNYMKSAALKTHDKNVEESLLMGEMFDTINTLSKPVIGVVNGAVFGGGLGLVSVCDIVLAHEKAVFALSEVKLGLAPSVISPFVIAKTGLSQARRYFLTGERFDARFARELNLVHLVFCDADRKTMLQELIDGMLANGPSAMAAIKDLIRQNAIQSGSELRKFTAEHISTLRASAEAQEGMTAFFEKRKPGFSL